MCFLVVNFFLSSLCFTLFLSLSFVICYPLSLLTVFKGENAEVLFEPSYQPRINSKSAKLTNATIVFLLSHNDLSSLPHLSLFCEVAL